MGCVLSVCGCEGDDGGDVSRGAGSSRRRRDGFSTQKTRTLSAFSDDTAAAQQLRDGVYKRYNSQSAIPMVRITEETPMTKLTGSRKKYLQTLHSVDTGESLPVPDMNLGDFIFEHLVEQRSHTDGDTDLLTIFCDNKNDIKTSTREEFIQQITNMENMLLQLGVSSGDRLLFLCPNHIQLPPLLVACHRRRLPCVMLTPSTLLDAKLRFELEELSIAYIFTISEYSKSAENILASLDCVKQIVLLDCRLTETNYRTSLSHLHKRHLSTSSSNTSGSSTHASPTGSHLTVTSECADGGGVVGVGGGERDRSWALEEAFVFWSMARTKPPAATRPIRLTHTNVIASVVQFLYAGAITRENRVLGLLPLYHSFGIAIQLYSSIIEGASLYLLQKMQPKAILECIKEEQISACIGVPPVVEFLSTQPPSATYLDGLLKVVTVLAPLKRHVIDNIFERLPHVMLFNGYGSTETCGVTHISSGDRAACGSIGQPLPNVFTKIQNEKRDRALAVRKRGEICIRGPMLSPFLEHDTQLQSYIDKLGWLRTGDIGYFDEELCFYAAAVIDKTQRAIQETDEDAERMIHSPQLRRFTSVRNADMSPILRQVMASKGQFDVPLPRSDNIRRSRCNSNQSDASRSDSVFE